MSKSQVKKLLATMDADSLRELVVDLYEARNEAKDYLDFFAAPDIDKRLDKARTLISRETARRPRGYYRPRMTRIRKYIKDIATLNPGQEYVVDIMAYAFDSLVSSYRGFFQESLLRNIIKLLGEIIVMADRNAILDLCLPRVREAIDGMPKRISLSHNRQRDELADALADALDSLTTAPA